MDSTIVPKSLPIDGQVKKDMFTSFCQGILAIGPPTIVNIF